MSKKVEKWRVYENSISFSDGIEYAGRLIDAYVASSLNRSAHLPDRLHRFLAITVHLNSLGVDISDHSAVKPFYAKYGGFHSKNGELSNYRRQLQDRGWLKKTKNGFRLPNFFYGYSDEVVVKINLKYVENEES